MIDNKREIWRLRLLEESKVIGIDTEWKPDLKLGSEKNGPSVLQMASRDFILIIDLISLKDNEELNLRLSAILTKPGLTVVGFGFVSDLFVFKKFLPKLTSIQVIDKFVDA